MLLMMDGEAPETCWAIHKRQVMNLWNCCILLVDLFQSYDDARTCERQTTTAGYSEGKISRFVFQAMSAILLHPIFLCRHHCTLIYPYADPASSVAVENFVWNIFPIDTVQRKFFNNINPCADSASSVGVENFVWNIFLIDTVQRKFFNNIY